jgi:hypothetical protein
LNSILSKNKLFSDVSFGIFGSLKNYLQEVKYISPSYLHNVKCTMWILPTVIVQ